MNNVIELNKLAEKITGENPNATIDAEAVKFIADNYSGGGGSNEYLLQFEGSKDVSPEILITDEDTIAKLEKIYNDFFIEQKVVVPELIYITEEYDERAICNFKECYICHDSDEGRYNINFGISYPLSLSGWVAIYGVTFSRNAKNKWYLRTATRLISKDVL